MRELDYLLTDVNSVLEFDEKLVLPGVSTHRAVVCSFTLPSSLAYARNVVGKLLDFRRVLPEEIAFLAAVAALHLWLASRSGWGIDRQI